MCQKGYCHTKNERGGVEKVETVVEMLKHVFVVMNKREMQACTYRGK